MAYFDNANFYPTLADEEFDIYSFLNQPPAIEQSSQQAYPAFANRWGTAGVPISLEATAGYGERYASTLDELCLTRDLQNRWLRPPHTRPRLTTTPSRRT